MSVNQGFLGRPVPYLLIIAHAHAVLVGFVLMLIIGVATWMFSRPPRENTRYRPELAQAVYWLMTLATALRFGAEVVSAYRPGRALELLASLGGRGQASAHRCLRRCGGWRRARDAAGVLRLVPAAEMGDANPQSFSIPLKG